MVSKECESVRGKLMGVALIRGATFARKAVTYYQVNGRAMVEGDICIGTVEQVQARMRAKATLEPFSAVASEASLRWPGGIVPYEIHPALPDKQRIFDALAHWESLTPIRFSARTPTHVDYIRFMDDGGRCWSHVGRQGGLQDLSVGSSCGTGSVIHELGHAVGLWHEQSREDRDHFVKVNWENVQPGAKAQFHQRITDGDDIGPYDYASIMHYGPKQFSKNKRDTLTPRAADVVIGQRSGLSPGDVQAVSTMYQSFL